MKKLKYILTRINKDSFKKLNNTVRKVHKVCKKPKIFIYCDIIICSLKYGAGYTDYYSFGMYDMNTKQRETVLTRGKNNSYVAMFNPKEYWHIFDNKNEFNEKFEKYLKRAWIYLENTSFDEFKKFIEPFSEVIAKPNNDSGGHGIEKIIVKDYESLEELYEYLMKKKLYLLEEIVVQHKELSAINPSSVNTIRIITLLHNNKVNFITAFLRIGNKNSFVDNTSSGGMLTMIDINRGVTLYPACDGNMNIYEFHPSTDKKIKDIKIPYFKETKNLIKELAIIVKDVKYIAWDIAITDDGPVVIEGNPYPGYYYQFPIHTPDKIGVIPVFDKILK